MSALIRELVELQEREGWLEDRALSELARRLKVPEHRLESLTTFYPHFRRSPPPEVRVEVCRDLSCELGQARAAQRRVSKSLAEKAGVELVEISCPGRCDQAPAGVIGDVPVCLSDHAAIEQAIADPSGVAFRGWGKGYSEADPYSQATEHYSTAPRWAKRPPAESVEALTEAGLRGMGGAAFPTGRKWALVAEAQGPDKFVICNADESEPGTFKDREILGALPHLVIEGMALAAHAVGARQGVVFIRHEYGPERRSLEEAIEAAQRAGLVGPGTGFELEVFVSPGGYILGEETALLECLEDRRGEPRNKPPYPGRVGLWGKPTLINNVETFAHATAILAKGVDWWKQLGRGSSDGHKFVSVSGDVAQPGVHLVPFGSSFADLLEACGGMAEGEGVMAFAPGGASSRFLGPEELSVAIDFDAVAQAGSMLGSGAVVFVASGRDLQAVGLSLTRFFRNESCGKCVPCRLGTDQAVKRIEAEGGVGPALRNDLESLSETLAQTSLCGLGQVALAPLLSLCARFPDQFGGD